MMTIAELYNAACAADAVFTDHLERVYGRRHAVEARYRWRWQHTDAALLTAYDAACAAREALRAAFAAERAAQGI